MRQWRHRRHTAGYKEGNTVSTIAGYALNSFVADLRDAFDSHKDLVGRANAVTAVLEHLLSVGGWVQEMIDRGEKLPGSAYTDDRCGDPAPGFHITCGAQKLGQTNDPHDHGAGWVVYGTYSGAIEQKRWAWDYANGLHQPRLVAKTSFLQPAGQAAYFLPGEIHTTRCDTDGSVVVRVESQKMSTLWRHRYDREANTARAFMG
jgi:predicted metal-dependent enzyme (double-stranded beta helix superfamily)